MAEKVEPWVLVVTVVSRSPPVLRAEARRAHGAAKADAVIGGGQMPKFLGPAVLVTVPRGVASLPATSDPHDTNGCLAARPSPAAAARDTPISWLLGFEVGL